MMAVDQTNREISIVDILRTLRRNFSLFTILTIGMGISIGTFWSLFPSSSEVSAVLEFRHPGIENGKNPNGSDFSVSQLDSNEIKEAALAAALSKHKEYDRSKIQSIVNSLKVIPLIPESIIEKQMADTKFIYYPRSFKFQIKQVNANAQEIKAALSYVEELVAINMNLYIDNHSTKLGFYPSFTEALFQNNELSEVIKIVEENFYTLTKVLNIQKDNRSAESNFPSEAERFTSPTNGLSIIDLKGRINILHEIQIKKIKSILSEVQIFKNPEEQRLILSSKISAKKSELETINLNLETTRALLQGEQKENTNVKSKGPLVVDISSNQESKRDSYLNTVINKHFFYQEDASRLTVEIKNLERDLHLLNLSLAGTDLDKDKVYSTRIKDLLISVQREMQEISEQAIVVFRDYNQSSSRIAETIRIVQDPTLTSSKKPNLFIISLISIILATVFSTATIFSLEFFRSIRPKLSRFDNAISDAIKEA